MYRQTLIKVKLQTGQRGQKTELTGRGTLRRGRSALDCSVEEEEGRRRGGKNKNEKRRRGGVECGEVVVVVCMYVRIKTDILFTIFSKILI